MASSTKTIQGSRHFWFENDYHQPFHHEIISHDRINPAIHNKFYPVILVQCNLVVGVLKQCKGCLAMFFTHGKWSLIVIHKADVHTTSYYFESNTSLCSHLHHLEHLTYAIHNFYFIYLQTTFLTIRFSNLALINPNDNCIDSNLGPTVYDMRRYNITCPLDEPNNDIPPKKRSKNRGQGGRLKRIHYSSDFSELWLTIYIHNCDSESYKTIIANCMDDLMFCSIQKAWQILKTNLVTFNLQKFYSIDEKFVCQLDNIPLDQIEQHLQYCEPKKHTLLEVITDLPLRFILYSPGEFGDLAKNPHMFAIKIFFFNYTNQHNMVIPGCCISM